MVGRDWGSDVRCLVAVGEGRSRDWVRGGLVLGHCLLELSLSLGTQVQVERGASVEKKRVREPVGDREKENQRGNTEASTE